MLRPFVAFKTIRMGHSSFASGHLKSSGIKPLSKQAFAAGCAMHTWKTR